MFRNVHEFSAAVSNRPLNMAWMRLGVPDFTELPPMTCVWDTPGITADSYRPLTRAVIMHLAQVVVFLTTGRPVSELQDTWKNELLHHLLSLGKPFQFIFANNLKEVEIDPVLKFTECLVVVDKIRETTEVKNGKKVLVEQFEELVTDSDFALRLTGQHRLDIFNEISHRSSFLNYYGFESHDTILSNINIEERRAVAYHFKVMHLLPQIRSWLSDFDKVLTAISLFDHFRDKIPSKETIEVITDMISKLDPCEDLFTEEDLNNHSQRFDEIVHSKGSAQEVRQGCGAEPGSNSHLLPLISLEPSSTPSFKPIGGVCSLSLRPLLRLYPGQRPQRAHGD